LNKWYNQDSFTHLADNEIHIWLNYLNIHEARIKHLYPLLSASEKERSERFKIFPTRIAASLPLSNHKTTITFNLT